VIGLLALVLLIAGCDGSRLSPLVEKGRMDLSGWDFDRDGPVEVTGKWSFYWEHFSRGAALPPSQYIEVPGLWRNRGNTEKALPSRGYATYGLKISGLSPGPHTLYISDTLSVAEVWINGRLAVSGGQIGKTQQGEVPDKHALFARFETRGNITEILIHVSNFNNMEGGINTPVWLGLDHQIRQKITHIWITTAFMSGALLLVGLYHLALFFIRQNEDSNLYFGLYCVMWACQTLFGVNGGCLMAELFPSLAWRVSIDATLLPYGIMPALMVMFYHALFPNRRAKPINGIFQVFGALFIAYILLTPPNAFDPMVLSFALVQAGAVLYLFAMFIHDLAKKREHIYFLIPGYLFLALTGINDLLNDMHIINTKIMVSYGGFFFILSYSIFISVRFSRAFSAVEQLSGRLRRQNTVLFQAFNTATENLRLKKELDIRESREVTLKMMQRRLSSLLNRVEDALVAVTPEQKIIFSNHAVTSLTGYDPDRLTGTGLGELLPQLPTKAFDQFPSESLAPEKDFFENMEVKSPDQTIIRADVSVSVLDLENEELMVIILKKARKNRLPASISPPLDLINRLNRNRGRLETLDALLNRQNRDDLTQKDQEGLNALIRLLDKIETPSSDTFDAQAKRRLGVEVMNMACTLWAATRGAKAELADKSGLWSIYIEKDGYARTQTLDKYLDIATLPARPRWKTILNTAEFVLAACEGPQELKKKLETLANRLKDLL